MPRYVTSADEKIPTPDDLRDKITALEKDFASFETHNDLNRATEACRQIIDTLEELMCYDSSDAVLKKLAYCYEWIGDDNMALDCYWKIYRNNENNVEAVESLCGFLQSMAWDAYMEDRTADAYELSLKALSLLQQYRRVNPEHDIDSSLAYAYKTAANIGINIDETEAIGHLQRALEIYRALESRQPMKNAEAYAEDIADILQFAKASGLNLLPTSEP